MSINSYHELIHHVGHRFECVLYDGYGEDGNVALECITCNEVIIDFNQQDEDENPDD